MNVINKVRETNGRDLNPSQATRFTTVRGPDQASCLL